MTDPTNASQASAPPFTLEDIVNRNFPPQVPIVDKMLLPGEIALFIGRQKEGKSTLALQLAIDVACGDPFLGNFTTHQTGVLYVDYENRPRRLKERGIDLLDGRPPSSVAHLSLKAYDRVSDRDVGLSNTQEQDRLTQLVRDLKPGLVIIDPLRYALGDDTQKEKTAMNLIERVSMLQKVNPDTAVIIVHHLKKQQDQREAVSPQDDAQTWIDQVYGSQALLAHSDTIWGLKEDDDGYSFVTVPRAQDKLNLRLEKKPNSERFILSPPQAQTACFKPAQIAAWNKLPASFSWKQGLKHGVANSTLDRVIRKARAAGLLTQDPITKQYSKVGAVQKIPKGTRARPKRIYGSRNVQIPANF